MDDKRLEDFGPEKFDGEEKVYYNETEYKDFDKSKHYHGSFFSAASMILAIGSFIYVLGGYYWIVLGMDAAALLLGLIALIRRHSSAGIAWSGCIIAAMILIASTVTFLDDSDHWERRHKDIDLPDYSDIIPDVSEYAAGLPEEVRI